MFAQALPNPALFDAGSCFGNAGLGSVLSAIWAPILPACPRWPLVDPDMLPAQVNPGKSRQIVAKETAHPRPLDQARSVDGSLPARRLILPDPTDAGAPSPLD